MKNTLKKFFNNPKKVAVVSIIIAIILAVIGYFYVRSSPSYTFVSAGSGTITQKNASVSTRDLTLSFLASGRVSAVKVKVGDSVNKDQVLATLDAGSALGTLSQARAAYSNAFANYQKVINGATGSAIDVAKAALNTAQVNLTEATKQQNVLVENAHRTLLSSNINPQSSDSFKLTPPTVTGAYTKTTEGVINISTYATLGNGVSNGGFSVSGIASGTGQLGVSYPQPLGDSGLFIQFPLSGNYINTNWTINIPDTSSSNYLPNYNAYQQALQTRSQVLAGAQAAVDQAQASLNQTVGTARPEDVAAAESQLENSRGTLQIAQAAYDNTVIKAPGDGKIIMVSVVPGQISAANAPAIELIASTTDQTVLVMVPKNSVLTKAGKNYVLKKTASGVVEQEIVIGVADDKNVEITSGLTAGDMVAVY